MAATTWFQVFYSARRGFESLEDFEKASEASDKLSSMSGSGLDDPRIGVLKSYLVSSTDGSQTGLLDDEHVQRLLDAMSPEHLAVVSEAVRKAYSEVGSAPLDESMRDVYAGVAAQALASQGSFLNKDRRVWRDDVTPLSEDAADGIMNSYAELVRGERSLRSVLRFVYSNGFQRLRYKSITGKDPKWLNDLLVAPYILHALTDVRQFDDDERLKFYDAFAGDWQTDSQFLDALSKNDRGKYVDMSDAEGYYKKIASRYSGADRLRICYPDLKAGVNSTTRLRRDAKDLAELFDRQKLSSPTLALVVEHLESWVGGSPVPGCVVNEGNADSVEKSIDEFCRLLFSQYSDALGKICQSLDEYDAAIREEFYSQEKSVTVPFGVKLWKDFHASGMYRLYGKTVDSCLKPKVDDLLSKNKYEVRFRGKDVPVFKDGLNVLKLCAAADLTNLAHEYSGYLDFVSAPLAKADLPIGAQLSVELQVVRFFKDFLSLDYKTFKNFEPETMLKNPAYCFDAICNLVYMRDKFIRESVVVETLFFGRRKLYEADDKVAYFDRLAKRIEAKTHSKDDRENLMVYAMKYADFTDDSDDAGADKAADSSAGAAPAQAGINSVEASAKGAIDAADGYGKGQS